MSKHPRNEPWPRPHDRRCINGTAYRLVHVHFSDDDWGSKLQLEYVEEGPYLAAQMMPQRSWWRRVGARLKRRRGHESDDPSNVVQSG